MTYLEDNSSLAQIMFIKVCAHFTRGMGRISFEVWEGWRNWSHENDQQTVQHCPDWPNVDPIYVLLSMLGMFGFHHLVFQTLLFMVTRHQIDLFIKLYLPLQRGVINLMLISFGASCIYQMSDSKSDENFCHPGPTFIKPDQRNPWIKDQLWNDLLSTILHLQLPNFVSCGRDKPSHMTQNLVTVGVKL